MSALECYNVARKAVVSLTYVSMSLVFVSHVNFEKCPCRCVEFLGQGPQYKYALPHKYMPIKKSCTALIIRFLLTPLMMTQQLIE